MHVIISLIKITLLSLPNYITVLANVTVMGVSNQIDPTLFAHRALIVDNSRNSHPPQCSASFFMFIMTIYGVIFVFICPSLPQAEWLIYI